MKKIFATILLAYCSIQNALAQKEQIFLDDLYAVRYETTGLFLGVTGLGLKSWNWGNQKNFKFQSEGWFGKNTHSGGMDKLGHSFSSYAVSNFLTDRFESKGVPIERAALNSFLITQGLMLYVELFDGFSSDHGFSKEDIVMNMLGSGFSFLRNTNPKLKEIVDFRIEYNKSQNSKFSPLSDYEGQKYLLAWKLNGINSLKQTPLKYVEFHTGYYARGFKSNSVDEKKREAFVGVSVNLNELLFENKTKSIPYKFFEHVQVPNFRIN